MATKTISLKLEAYEKLRAARRYPTESFSQVVLRASWPEDTLRASDLLARYRRLGASFSEEMLDEMEHLKTTDPPAEDKWVR